MNPLKKLFGQAAIYGASSVIGRAINFFLVPLYSSVFQPADYAVVIDLYVYVALLMVLYLFGIETTFFRFSTKYDSRLHFFRLSVTHTLGTSLLLSGAIYAFAPTLAGWLEYPEHAAFIRWLAIILALDTVVAVPFAQLRLEGRAARFASLKLVNIGVNVGANIFFLVFCPYWLQQSSDTTLTVWIEGFYHPEHQLAYVFLSNLLASGITFLMLLPSLFNYRWTFDVQKWRQMMSYALPIVIIGFAGQTNEMLSRALLRHWLPEGFYPGRTSLESLGIFGACYKLSMLMTLSVQAFRYAYEPFFFSHSIEKESPTLFARVMHHFIIYGTAAVVVITLILPWAAPIVLRRPAYLEALHVVPFLLWAGLLLGIHFNLSIWYKLTDKTHYGAWIVSIGAVLTIALNLLLIPYYGYEGSTAATLFTYLIMVSISYGWGQRHYPVPYQLRVLIYPGWVLIWLMTAQLDFTDGSLRTIWALSGPVIFLFLLTLLERRNRVA